MRHVTTAQARQVAIDALLRAEAERLPEPAASPRAIEIRAEVCGGMPTVSGTGVRVDAISDRFAAGDSIAHLAEDYTLSVEQVEEAIRFALTCAKRR